MLHFTQAIGGQMTRSRPRATIYEAIDRERDRQDRRWGSQRRQSPYKWLTILTEEVGEAAEAALHLEEFGPSFTPSSLTKELVQVAAVAVCWLEALEEGEKDDQD